MSTSAMDINKRWTLEYPELGTDPVPTEPCISPAYFALERERVFRRVWLKVGREEEIPQPGDYFVKEMAVWNTSIVVIRGKDGVIRAFHNICSHRGNKLVWEAQGSCRALSCKFHGWTYAPEGRLIFVPDEEMFYNLEKNENGLLPVAADIWEGFIFVNIDPRPKETLTEYLGEIGERLRGFPFREMTKVYAYQTELKCNWKIALDAFQEAYHVSFIHKRSFPDSFTGKDNPFCHFFDVRLYARHYVAAAYGNPEHKPTATAAIAYQLGTASIAKRTGLSMERLPPEVNPTRSPYFGFEQDFFFPNFLVHVMDGLYFTHQFWPVAVDRTLWEGIQYFPPPVNAGERFSQEYGQCLQRNAWLEDTGTMEATHAALASGVKTHFNLQDQEILLRHSYQVLEDYVGFYRQR